MRKTKIICTIGPKTGTYEKIEALAENGMNIARLNMSHGDHLWHAGVIRAIKTINSKAHYSIAIMLDTKGAEIRTGDVRSVITLGKGDRFTFTIRKETDYEPNCTEISYDGFINDVKKDDILLIDGGMLSFVVIEKTATDVICTCVDGGTLTSRRHLNIKGKSAKLPSITNKDKKDILFAIEQGVDFIALSFVKNAKAITNLKDFLAKKNAPIDVIAKIESAGAIPNIKEIIDVSDGVMVARGDLGAELPIEEVPLLQEEIIDQCRALGKPVIVATHLLESMISNPTPTRAEVTDIAQAVREKADAIMLSGETATGKYPLKTVNVMHTVAQRIEEKIAEHSRIEVEPTNDPKIEIARSASIMANNLGAAAMVIITRRGHMAALISRCRPKAPIAAFTNMTGVRRRLALYWGVISFRIEFSHDPEKTIQRALTALKEKGVVKASSMVIVVSDILAGDEFVESVQIRRI